MTPDTKSYKNPLQMINIKILTLTSNRILGTFISRIYEKQSRNYRRRGLELKTYRTTTNKSKFTIIPVIQINVLLKV